jgi:hypothetical protein
MSSLDSCHALRTTGSIPYKRGELLLLIPFSNFLYFLVGGEGRRAPFYMIKEYYSLSAEQMLVVTVTIPS